MSSFQLAALTGPPITRVGRVGHIGWSVIRRSPTCALVPVVLVMVALFAPAASASQTTLPSVTPPEAGQIDGRTYGQWSAEWWTQGYAQPTSVSPFLEEGAANCGLG